MRSKGFIPARRALGLILAGFLISGCSSVLPARPPTPELFQLTPHTDASASDATAAIAGPWQIVIEPPLAVLGLDTDRIAARTGPYEIKYIAGARWTDRAPLLVQAGLVDALRATGHFAGVGRTQDSLRTDYTLVSELKAFEVKTYGRGTPVAHVDLSVQLVRKPAGKVAGARRFSAEVDATGRAPVDAVRALDEALGEVLDATASWVTAHSPRDDAPLNTARGPGEE